MGKTYDGIHRISFLMTLMAKSNMSLTISKPAITTRCAELAERTRLITLLHSVLARLRSAHLTSRDQDHILAFPSTRVSNSFFAER